AERAGVIKAVHVKVGDKVAEGSLLVEIEPADEEADSSAQQGASGDVAGTAQASTTAAAGASTAPAPVPVPAAVPAQDTGGANGPQASSTGATFAAPGIDGTTGTVSRQGGSPEHDHTPSVAGSPAFDD